MYNRLEFLERAFLSRRSSTLLRDTTHFSFVPCDVAFTGTQPFSKCSVCLPTHKCRTSPPLWLFLNWIPTPRLSLRKRHRNGGGREVDPLNSQWRGRSAGRAQWGSGEIRPENQWGSGFPRCPHLRIFYFTCILQGHLIYLFFSGDRSLTDAFPNEGDKFPRRRKKYREVGGDPVGFGARYRYATLSIGRWQAIGNKVYRKIKLVRIEKKFVRNKIKHFYLERKSFSKNFKKLQWRIYTI